MTLQLLSTTEVYQLAKLPLLFEHYTAHKAANKNVTIWGFLHEHYFINDPADPDYAADMQLPFKTHNDCIAYNISALRFVQQPAQAFVTFQFTERTNKQYQRYKQPILTSAHLSSVWQPPKAV